MNQPDKLFNDKLSGYQPKVPMSAWNRVDANLNKKDTKAIWLKVAASVALVLGTSYLLWVNTDQKNTQVAEIASPRTITQQNIEGDKEKKTKVVKSDTQSKKATPVKENKKTKSTNIIKTSPSNIQPVNEMALEEKFNETELLKENSVINKHDSTLIKSDETLLASAENIKEDQTITLVLTSQEVNEKYLTKNKNEDATSEVKKQSTLRKLLEKAYDLKHNQDPFGELRQKKNEILALNFKNEKQRSQNR